MTDISPSARMAAGYRANDDARERVDVERTAEGDKLRATADAVDARLGHPSSFTAQLRARAAYTDSAAREAAK